MKRFTGVLVILSALVMCASAETGDITRQWLMTTAALGGNTEEVYKTVTFNLDGSTVMEGRNFGTWKADTTGQTIEIRSEMIPEFAGNWEIVKKSAGKLVLQSNHGTLSFIAYNPDKIAQANQASHLAGVWKLGVKNDENADVYLYFKTPDKLLLYLQGEGFTGRVSGRWFFDEKEQSVLITARENLLKGKSFLKQVSPTAFLLENKGEKITGTRLQQNAADREQLPSFENISTMVENNGDTTNSPLCSETFPWYNREAKEDYLRHIAALEYKKSTLLEGFDVFVTKDITAHLSFDENDGTVEMDDIFTPLPMADCSEDTVFYPLEEPFEYALSGEKEITVPAGTFECLVIDFADDFNESRTRLYMIRNRPGVYAKIVTITKDFNEEIYTKYELSGIKGTFTPQKISPVISRWILTELIRNGKSQRKGEPFEFVNDGRVLITRAGEIDTGRWTFNSDEKTVLLDFDGNPQPFSIEMLSNKSMVLKNKSVTYTFIKFEPDTAGTAPENPKVTGYWMLTNTPDPYRVMHLTDSYEVFDVDRIYASPLEDNYPKREGTWLFNPETSSIIFMTDEYESLCYGSRKISRLTDQLLVLGEGNDRLVFIKIKPDKLVKGNKASGLTGIWRIKGRNGTYNYYDFTDPFLFRKGASMEDMPKTGLWYYDRQNKMLFLGYQMHQLEGFSKITSISSTRIEFENSLIAERVE